MPPKEFSIVLEYPNGKFYLPGDTLRGKVVMQLGKKNRYETLKIILLGRARNSWYEKEDAGPYILEAIEEYIDFMAELDIQQSINNEKVEYGFEYELSEGLPSSFSSQYGGVTYVVKAILDGNKELEVTRQEFLISGQLNLNEIPEASKPIELNLSQPLLFEEGQLHMEVKLKKVGFIPGEKVFMEAHFSNESLQEVHANLYLMKETIFFIKDQRVANTEILVSHEGPTVKPQASEIWVGDVLEFPMISAPFPNLQNCHIINVRYYLTVEMEIPMPNVNLEGKIPLVVGTVALKNTEEVKDLHQESTTDVVENNNSSTTLSSTENANIKKIHGRGMRRNRPMTTCMVFRPDRPRLKLPEPNPESWTKFNKKIEMNGEDGILPRANDLHGDENVSSGFNAPPPSPAPASPSPASPAPISPASPAPISPASPASLSPSAKESTENQKWPKPYIRRRQVPIPNIEKENPETLQEPPQPPPRPDRLKKSKPLPPTPQTTSSDIPVCGRGGKRSKEKPVLPYPVTIPQNFPVPDFSFNVSISGQKREPIGWNVTRNTLTLKRGVYRLREQ